MVGEAPGPVNFTQMVTLFAEKMSGGSDDDKIILMAFEAFEINGQIDAEMFRHSLMTWGEEVLVERDRRRLPRVQDRRRHDRRRTPQEHHGGEEGGRGINLSLKESHLVKKNDSGQKWVSFLIAKKRYL